MTRRPGLSLTEVLVALFIMGIGTIAVLTLFPLAALNMAQAFRDDRTTQSAAQADAFLRWYVKNKKDDGQLTPVPGPPAVQGEAFITPLSDPGSTTFSKFLIPLPTTQLPTNPVLPSYAVVIDPIGFNARGGKDNSLPNPSRTFWIGDGGFGNGAGSAQSSAVSRRSIRMVTDLNPLAADVARQQPFTLRLCTLLDGFGYDKASGAPDTFGGTAPIDRDVRYNWLWVIQKRDNTSPNATLTVVVFDKRAPNFAPPGSETVFTPTVAMPGQTQLTFALGQVPAVQKGGWLMDATVVAADATGTTFVVPAAGDPTGPAPGFQAWIRNANFYRVASVTDNGAGADIELDTPLKPDAIPNPAPPTATVPLPAQFRRFVYLSGVAEVFERSDSLVLQ